MNLVRWRSPPQRYEEPREYHYANLRGENSIRLVQLLPGSGSKGVAINLVDSHVSGSNQIPYDALSYTWGDGGRNKTITCHGRRMAVTKTLLEALHRFRDPDNIVILWIDQICICQERTKERNQQVQMMGDIFKSARKVIVWLGDEYDDSRAGMQLARQLLSIVRHQPVSGLTPADLDAHGLPKQGHRRWKALAGILRRPWFFRTWVVQEVVLNPNVDIVLGSSTMAWDELESVVALLEGPMPRIWQADQAISAFELPFSRINRIRLRHMHRILTPVTPIKLETQLDASVSFDEPVAWNNDSEADAPELLDLLLMSRGLGATDPRDKIYALLGLGKHDIETDYSSSPESVFCDFALRTIGIVSAMTSHRESSGLEISPYDREVRRAMVLLSCAGRPNQKLSLPSWVPDWTVNLACRPLIFGFGGQRYCAGGTKLGMFDWSPDFGLQLDGLLVDTIQAVGVVHLDADPLDSSATELIKLIESWWLEARQIAFQRIARSPGSTGSTDAFDAMRRRLFLCRHGYYVGETKQKRRSSLLEDAEPSPENSDHSASQTMLLGPTRGRVVFASSTGFLGLVPFGAREGDVLFVIRGADVPFVLRPQADGAYELIGEAYMQGIMGGEALEGGFGMAQDVMIR